MKKDKKVYLYTYTLGETQADCQPSEGDMNCAWWLTKKEAIKNMKRLKKESGWPAGAIIRITLEKVRT